MKTIVARFVREALHAISRRAQDLELASCPVSHHAGTVALCCRQRKHGGRDLLRLGRESLRTCGARDQRDGGDGDESGSTHVRNPEKKGNDGVVSAIGTGS